MADYLRGLLSQQGALAQPEQPSIWGALRDPQFYSDVGSRLADLLRSGVQDVVPNGTRTQRLADLLGTQRDPNYLQKITDMGLAGMTVYHGSPYKFDKFDMSKIGTGEGAQAYGHGLYFAENPATAISYKNDLATQIDAGGSTILKNNKKIGTTGNSSVDDLLIAHNGDVDAAIKYVKSAMNDGVASRRGYEPELAMLESMRPTVKAQNTGALYRVDLPDEHIAKMLDWDKPLSQQPDILKKLRDDPLFGVNSPGWKGAPDGQWEFNMGARTGEQILRDPRIGGADQNKASEYLRAIGIPGIRYLDGGSRSGGKGTSNFVVFDDQLPKIIGRE